MIGEVVVLCIAVVVPRQLFICESVVASSPRLIHKGPCIHLTQEITTVVDQKVTGTHAVSNDIYLIAPYFLIRPDNNSTLPRLPPRSDLNNKKYSQNYLLTPTSFIKTMESL